MELLVIFVLVLLNGLFSMSEMSLVSSKKFKLEAEKKRGSKGAETALALSENPTRFLSTVQIGITLIGILLGVFSGEKMTEQLVVFLNHFPLLAPYSKTIAVGIIVTSITFLSILFGELLPKRIGMTFPETIAILLARPMKILSFITAPFVWLLTFSNDLMLRILGIKRLNDCRVSEEEIKSLIKESAEGGEILDIEQNIVERVFELGDRKVNSLYTHRTDVLFFDNNETLDDIKLKVSEDKHAAYPVCENGDLNKVNGVVLIKDLFTAEQNNFQLKNYLRNPVYVNKSMLAYKVVELFKQEGIHFGIVIDEFGGVEGVVTMDDIKDALIGDHTEQHQDEYSITKRDSNSWLVDGQYSIIEFLKYFEIDSEEGFETYYTTVAGFLIHSAETLPQVGFKLEAHGLKFEVIDKDGQRIDKVMVTKM